MATTVRDDTTVQNQVINATRLSNSARIIPQDNLLSQYSSYTYNLSLYIMSPENFRKIVRSGQLSISGAQLLMSSGGAPVGSTNSPVNPTANLTGVNDIRRANNAVGRSQEFPLDYYFDDVKLTSMQPGKGTRSAHSNTMLDFKIIEPNGISFLDNLYAATEKYVGKKQNYGAQNFCLVIKFYGYDENGKLVQAQGIETGGGGQALIEKWIPFQFIGIKFRIANRSTEYDCSAICVGNNIASGQARGIIPYNVEINAPTLKEILAGNSVITTAFPPAAAPAPGGAAPPKANVAPKPKIVSGLIDSLNQIQQQLASDGVFEYPDEYSIVFTDSRIENASVLPPGPIPRQQAANAPPATTANQAVNGATQTGAAGSKAVSATAGTSIIQFLDQTIRNSGYIYNQQLEIFDSNGIAVTQNVDYNQGVDWYRIGFRVEPKEYDRKRRDYAYKITYIVSPYKVNDVKGPQFPKSKFVGTHKRYLYWFTGLNNEIINYEQDFNFLYYVVVNSAQRTPTSVVDWREKEKFAYQTRSNESDQGLSSKTNDAGANAADQLNSPTDLARVKLTIMGDPAWIHSDSFWRGYTDGTTTAQPFFADGSINTQVQEPLFEVGFNKPVDYNLTSGRMEVNDTQLGANRYVTDVNGNGLAAASHIYKTVSVISTFSKGRFTQELEGILVLFPAIGISSNNPKSEQAVAQRDNERVASTTDRAAQARRARDTSTASAASSGAASTATPATATSSLVTAAAPAPAAPAAAPTSSGQTVGAANAQSATNLQSGGTVQTSRTVTTFNEAEFQRNDPSAYAQFSTYRQDQQQQIFAQRREALLSQALANGTVTDLQLDLINQEAVRYAQSQAQANSIQQYQPQIESSGASTVIDITNPVAQQGTTVSRPPQIGNRDY